jgi:DNA-binding CsgD family transcriptional regulator
VELVRRVEAICAAGPAERELRIAVLAELRAAIPFDAYAWLLTDPETSVGWSPVAEVPVMADLPEIIRAKYLTTLNRWTDLAAGQVVTLGNDPARSLVWREWQSTYGISDVASTVLRDRFGCWGFLDLWRRDGSFAGAELAVLATVVDAVTPAIRRAQLATFAEPAPTAVAGPAVMVLGPALRPLGRTPPTYAHLAALLPAAGGRDAVPAAAFNVAAQLCAVEAGVVDGVARSRVFVPGASWMTARAARLATASADAEIAVTFETAGPAERAALYARVAGLSGREGDVLRAVAAGHDTRRVAQLLGISAHTVQDHLKATFAKTGADSRRQLVARATGTL